MSDIEKDIKRCEKLTEPQNANWIGISNQLAIAGALARIKELEEINTANRKVIVEQCDYIQNRSIPAQKVNDEIEELKDTLKHYNEYSKLNLLEKVDVDLIDARIEILQELLQESEDK